MPVCRSRTDFQLKCPLLRFPEFIKKWTQIPPKSAKTGKKCHRFANYVHNCQCLAVDGLSLSGCWVKPLTDCGGISNWSLDRKGHFIICHYSELIGITDATVVIRHQVDETKKTEVDYIFRLQPKVIPTPCKGFSGGFKWCQSCNFIVLWVFRSIYSSTSYNRTTDRFWKCPQHHCFVTWIWPKFLGVLCYIFFGTNEKQKKTKTN